MRKAHVGNVLNGKQFHLNMLLEFIIVCSFTFVSPFERFAVEINFVANKSFLCFWGVGNTMIFFSRRSCHKWSQFIWKMKILWKKTWKRRKKRVNNFELKEPLIFHHWFDNTFLGVKLSLFCFVNKTLSQHWKCVSKRVAYLNFIFLTFFFFLFMTYDLMQYNVIMYTCVLMAKGNYLFGLRLTHIVDSLYLNINWLFVCQRFFTVNLCWKIKHTSSTLHFQTENKKMKTIRMEWK